MNFLRDNCGLLIGIAAVLTFLVLLFSCGGPTPAPTTGVAFSEAR